MTRYTTMATFQSMQALPADTQWQCEVIPHNINRHINLYYLHLHNDLQSILTPTGGAPEPGGTYIKSSQVKTAEHQNVKLLQSSTQNS